MCFPKESKINTESQFDLEEHNKRKQKKEKEMDAKCHETGGEVHGSVHGISERWTIYGMNNQETGNRMCSTYGFNGIKMNE